MCISSFPIRLSTHSARRTALGLASVGLGSVWLWICGSGSGLGRLCAASTAEQHLNIFIFVVCVAAAEAAISALSSNVCECVGNFHSHFYFRYCRSGVDVWYVCSFFVRLHLRIFYVLLFRSFVVSPNAASSIIHPNGVTWKWAEH